MSKLMAALALVLSSLATPASAGFLGNALRLDYFYPTLASSLANITLVAPFGVIYTCCVSTEFTPAGSVLFVSVDDDSIIITGERSQVFDNATFNGMQFQDILDSIDAIVGVSLVESTLPGLDATDIGFGANRVLVNFAGANGFNLTEWRVELAVTFAAAAVPEPGTLALLGLGLAGLAAVRRRERN